MAIKADVQLDAKGLACPMPIVKTKKAMNNLEDGQILEVQATDKGSMADLAAWAETVGHQYIGYNRRRWMCSITIFVNVSEVMMQMEKTFEQTISNEEIVSTCNNGGMILDVREEAEYAFGHIRGAKSIPMGELEDA